MLLHLQLIVWLLFWFATNYCYTLNAIYTWDVTGARPSLNLCRVWDCDCDLCQFIVVRRNGVVFMLICITISSRRLRHFDVDAVCDNGADNDDTNDEISCTELPTWKVESKKGHRWTTVTDLWPMMSTMTQTSGSPQCIAIFGSGSWT